MRRLYWNYVFHLAFFLPPCVALILNPAKAGAYGLRRSHLTHAMKIGALFAVPLIAAPLVAETPAGTIHLRPPLPGGSCFGCNFYRFLFGMDLYAGIATGAAWFVIFWRLPRLWSKIPAPSAQARGTGFDQ